ncbi:MAG: SAM-dependent methyltransferase [Burkholderiales bacterium]|nr:SAM-dependent methyltransferase [Opitutaceae bacterium]
MPPAPSALARFHALLHEALTGGTLVKLTLGKPRPDAADPTLRNVFARPVELKAGPHVCLVYRHATRDVTKNLAPADAATALAALLAETFFDAHLFTPLHTAQLEQSADPARPARLRLKTADSAPPIPAPTHDRPKQHVLAPDAPWLRALGVTNERGQPREGMAHKFRQIEKFAELLQTLLAESALCESVLSESVTGVPPVGGMGVSPMISESSPPIPSPLRIADMGSGKGYLTFALAALLGPRARITGLERRADLVATCNRVATECGFAPHLHFLEGDIPTPTPSPTPDSDSSALRPSPFALRPLDVLIALHACDTATDDALAAGHAAGARLLVVSPCCQKELRAQLTAPPVLADALRHGIFQERQAEFVTDALRAQLLEAAGYRTKVFEFISTEHTAKNLLIVALRPAPLHPGATTPVSPGALARARAFAAFYGIREQRLARHLGLALQG